MRKLRSGVVLVFLLLSTYQLFAQSSQQPIDLNALDAYIANAVKSWELPGMAVGIVKNDSVIFAKGYGVKEMGKPDPVTTHTMFAIASLSKAFTAASLGMMVEQGKLKWNDKVTQYLPYFQMYDPYVTREMTVRDLLCHRSGLHTFGGDLIWYGTKYDRKEVVRRIRYLKPRYSFRANYGYQNIMFLAAGEVLTAVSGKSWDDFVRDNIFNPLGMTGTNTSVTLLADNPDVATPHTTYKGTLITVPYRNVDNVGSAAAINSNVNDLAKWIKMWLRDEQSSGTKLLKEETKHEIFSPQTVLPITQRGMKFIPSRHFSAAGLGWFMNDYLGKKVLNHSGGMDGMISRLVLVPEEKFGFVILTNSINSVSTPVMYKILDTFLGGPERDWSAEYLAQKHTSDSTAAEAEKKMIADRVKNTKPSLPLLKYTGTYRSEMYGDVIVDMESNALIVRFLPTDSYVGDLTHWHYDTFQINLRDKTLPAGMVTFLLDANGKPSEMKVDIPNPDFDFTELELKRID
jgi:CubicO group peptidase (beta-lactamase class C family)